MLQKINLLGDHDQNDADVQKWLTDVRKRERLLEPFKGFVNFVAGYNGQERPDYANIRRWQIGGKNIALIGLNSAWMCGRNKNVVGEIDDKNYVLVGEPQIHDQLEQLSKAEVKIAVLHHPFDWLAEFDCNRVENRLMRQCDFILHGHQHKPQVNVIKSTLGDCVIIPAGACYNRRNAEDPSYTNAYNFVHLDYETGKCIVFLRRWSDPRSEWIEDIDSQPNGRFEFYMSRVTAKALRSPVESEKNTSIEKNDGHSEHASQMEIEAGIIYDAFISYSHDNEDIVEDIAGRLKEEESLEIWLDKWRLIPGDSWQQEMAHGLEKSRSCVVCIGSDKPSGWHKEEIQHALSIKIGKDPTFRVIPLLLPGSKSEYVENFLSNRLWVDISDESKLDEGIYRIVCGIRGLQPGTYSSKKRITENPIQSFDIEEMLRRFNLYRQKGLICEEIHREYQRKVLDYDIQKLGGGLK